MTNAVAELVRLSKQDLFDRSGTDMITQSGGEVIDENFSLPSINRDIVGALPSIETFVVAASGDISAMGTDAALVAGWLPAVDELVRQVSQWAHKAGIELADGAYVTASVTDASMVNGQAHFDDDQFNANAGSGLVAIVGDLAGPRVATAPIPHPNIDPPRPVSADDTLIEHFANGTIASTDYGPNELVVLPQFAQLHAGPGPCGTSEQVRHLLVYRAATVATTSPEGPRE